MKCTCRSSCELVFNKLRRAGVLRHPSSAAQPAHSQGKPCRFSCSLSCSRPSQSKLCRPSSSTREQQVNLLSRARTRPSLELKPLLLFRRTGYRHDSIPTAIQALSNQSTLNGGQYEYRFTFSEDPDLFTDDGLKGFDLLLFISNSDERKSPSPIPPRSPRDRLLTF